VFVRQKVSCPTEIGKGGGHKTRKASLRKEALSERGYPLVHVHDDLDVRRLVLARSWLEEEVETDEYGSNREKNDDELHHSSFLCERYVGPRIRHLDGYVNSTRHDLGGFAILLPLSP